MIQVRGLTKYYGEHAAIRDLDFDIDQGEVIGFLGLNGAGKTTTLKILGCVLLPTSGSVRVDGLDALLNPHEVRKRIGLLPDVPPLYPDMAVSEYLSFAAQLRGVSGADVRRRVLEAEDRTGLRDVDSELIANLSHGYRQRVGVAQALVHKPALLILDEPTSGLDPVQIVEMRNLIRSLRGEHTLLISSHFLSEISQTCDRLLVIQNGVIVSQGSEEELAARVGSGGEIEMRIKGSAPLVTERLKRFPGVLEVTATEAEHGEVDLRVRASMDVRAALVRELVAAGVDVLRLDRGTSRLEEIFMKVTRATGDSGTSKGALA